MYARFERDGYIVVNDVLDAETRHELLDQILGDTRAGSKSYVHQGECRLHTPLRLTNLVRGAVSAIVNSGYEVLDNFLPTERHLAELSSLTSFPGAQGQAIHPDEINEGRTLVTCFANLFDTSEEAGALRIIPGSHKEPTRPHPETEAIPMIAPAGSVVLMNSKTHHAGGANTSHDRIRPVFYASFGDINLHGPTYSIVPELRGALRLDDFRSVPLRPEQQVGLTSLLSKDLKDPLHLFVHSDVELSEIDVNDDLLKMLEQLSGSSEALSVAKLAEATGVDLDFATASLGQLRGLGVIRVV